MGLQRVRHDSVAKHQQIPIMSKLEESLLKKKKIYITVGVFPSGSDGKESVGNVGDLG